MQSFLGKGMLPGDLGEQARRRPLWLLEKNFLPLPTPLDQSPLY